MKRSISLFVSALFVSLVACSGSDDPASACTDLCTTAGFQDGRVDVQPNEINCFCTGGSGTVSDEACTNMCASTDKSGSQTFGTGPNLKDACQCH